MTNTSNIVFIIVIAVFAILGRFWKHQNFQRRRKLRREYYRNVYLKSEAWKRKRYVVLKRDHWKCRYCGKRATQVHHKRYARNIGREPIKWLVSVCASCHKSLH